MENILLNLTVKRPKVRVIDKLLELGLVNNRKQLYKKGSKSKVGHMRNGKIFFFTHAFSFVSL